MPTASASAVTRFGMGGWGVRRAGSFSGKAAAGVEITPSEILNLPGRSVNLILPGRSINLSLSGRSTNLNLPDR